MSSIGQTHARAFYQQQQPWMYGGRNPPTFPGGQGGGAGGQSGQATMSDCGRPSINWLNGKILDTGNPYASQAPTAPGEFNQMDPIYQQYNVVFDNGACYVESASNNVGNGQRTGIAVCNSQWGSFGFFDIDTRQTVHWGDRGHPYNFFLHRPTYLQQHLLRRLLLRRLLLRRRLGFAGPGGPGGPGGPPPWMMMMGGGPGGGPGGPSCGPGGPMGGPSCGPGGPGQPIMPWSNMPPPSMMQLQQGQWPPRGGGGPGGPPPWMRGGRGGGPPGGPGGGPPGGGPPGGMPPWMRGGRGGGGPPGGPPSMGGGPPGGGGGPPSGGGGGSGQWCQGSNRMINGQVNMGGGWQNFVAAIDSGTPTVMPGDIGRGGGGGGGNSQLQFKFDPNPNPITIPVNWGAPQAQGAPFSYVSSYWMSKAVKLELTKDFIIVTSQADKSKILTYSCNGGAPVAGDSRQHSGATAGVPTLRAPQPRRSGFYIYPPPPMSKECLEHPERPCPMLL